MIGRRAKQTTDQEEVIAPKGFDDFDLKLGDILRGERATMGKSLLDVQRELRIKASYIAAIENCDPQAFDTPGFIAGYVRSYARYLNMDPDDTFKAFCEESGFAVAHGMSAEASSIKKSTLDDKIGTAAATDIFADPKTPFVPVGNSVWSQIEPGAIGSSAVLLSLICAIGYGGWTVLQEIQRVQVAPVDQTPVVLSNLDPLDNVPVVEQGIDVLPNPDQALRADRLDRLYRPQALDVPVLTARDAPIATLDPRDLGNFAAPDRAPTTDEINGAIASVLDVPDISPSPLPVPQVVADAAPQLTMVAVRPSWVRVRSADGTVIFEKTMQAGDSWNVPLTEEPPTLRTGESGAIYFAMDNTFYGPVGASGQVTSNLALASDDLRARYTVADLTSDQGLQRYAEAQTVIPTE